MADALTAIGLVANIIQFVSFSFALVSKTKELHQSTSGALSENIELSVISQDIKTFSSKIRANAGPSLHLFDITQRCEAVAVELLGAISKLQHKQHALGSGKAPTRWRSFRKALKTVWDKPHIEELKMRLEQLRDQMMMHLISNTNDNQVQLTDLLEDWKEKNMQAGYEITAQIQELDTELQDIQERVSNLHSDSFWKTLNDCFSRFSSEVHLVSQRHVIIASLRYECMQLRYCAIRDAHKRTFAWMYSGYAPDTPIPRPTTTFAQWLQCGGGIYWITGKPGSGKSTLMKYLYDHDDTTRNLEVWSNNARLVKACFYFWSPGQQMQKSLEGLLQTLLHAILNACPELTSIICPERWHAEYLSQPHGIDQKPWTLSELHRSFALFRTQTTMATKFYFQVDGLDEYYGDSWDVIEILRDLSSAPNVKLCLSSRPWNCFQKSFGQSNPNVLRIHEFTRPDIELFARENLQSQGLCTDSENTLFEDLVREIGDRAQGVFLWVRLVVRSLRNGIVNHDPISILQQRLREISTDLEEFFEQILGSVEEIYRSRMARTFIVAMRSPHQLNLIEYYLLDQEKPSYNFDMPSETWCKSEIQRRAIQTEQQLNGRYKGLLEVVSTRHIDWKTKVDFLHRTLRDFLATKYMRDKLQFWASQPVNAFIAISRALIAESKFIKACSSPDDYKLAIELASKGAHETGDSAHCYEIIDQAELESERMRPSHASCGLNCYILRFAAAVGQAEYLKYRIHGGGAVLNLDCILKHAIVCPVDSHETYDSCLPPTFTPYEMSVQCRKSSTSFLTDPTLGSAPLPSLVAVLFEHGADPNIIVDGESSWMALAGEAIKWMDSKHRTQYWAVLELFLQKGVDVNLATGHWIKILERQSAASDSNLRNTLSHFERLFSHRLSPNVSIQDTTLAKNFLRRLTWTSHHITDTSRSIQHDLLREFLCNGADISAVYNDWADHGWFRTVCRELERQCSKILSNRVTQYRIFLEHGLDPNTTTYSGCTMWEGLLNAIQLGIQEPLPQEADSLIIRELFLMSLQYGADPYIEMISKVLGWMKRDGSLLSKDDIADVERALQSEIDQREQQAESRPFHHSRHDGQSGGGGGGLECSHIPRAIARRQPQRPEKRNCEHISHGGQHWNVKRVRIESRL